VNKVDDEFTDVPHDRLPEYHASLVCVCVRVDDDTTQTSSSVCSHPVLSDVNCRPSSQSSSGHVTSLIERLQPPPPRSPTHTSGRSLIDALHAHTSAALGVGGAGQSTLAGAVLGGVDLSLAAVVLGASSQSPAVTSPSTPRRQPEMRIHVTTESPERTVTTPASRGQHTAGVIGRRSVGVPHGSLRAFQQQQQQYSAGRQVAQQHNTLLVVPPSSSRSTPSSPSMMVSTRGGSVSTSPSSGSPSPSPEPISRSGAGHSCATSRSLSTHRPLGVTRPTIATATTAAADEHSKPSRTCVQRHCDQRQRPGGQTSRTDEQETFV